MEEGRADSSCDERAIVSSLLAVSCVLIVAGSGAEMDGAIETAGSLVNLIKSTGSDLIAANYESWPMLPGAAIVMVLMAVGWYLVAIGHWAPWKLPR